MCDSIADSFFSNFFSSYWWVSSKMMMTMKNRNDLYLPSIGACVCLSNAKQTGRPTYKNVRIARSGTHTKSINEIAGKKLIQNEFQNHPSKNLLFLWQVKWASFSGKNSKWFFSIKKMYDVVRTNIFRLRFCFLRFFLILSPALPEFYLNKINWGKWIYVAYIKTDKIQYPLNGIRVITKQCLSCFFRTTKKRVLLFFLLSFHIRVQSKLDKFNQCLLNIVFESKAINIRHF